MSRFTYRLVEVATWQSVEWENGPGSLQNVVSDSSGSILRQWHDMPDDYGVSLLSEVKEDFPHLFRDFSFDGETEYEYQLERSPTGDNHAWKFVGFVRQTSTSGRDTSLEGSDFWDDEC
jgi:hypothetical protein